MCCATQSQSCVITMVQHRLATLATCNLNQWAMDFGGNLERIKASITQARAKGARYRVGATVPSGLHDWSMCCVSRGALHCPGGSRAGGAWLRLRRPLPRAGHHRALLGVHSGAAAALVMWFNHAHLRLGIPVCHTQHGAIPFASRSGFSFRRGLAHHRPAAQALVRDGFTDGIVCDVGLPIMHRGVRYNCRLFLLNGKLLLLRPKQNLADDGNYRQGPTPGRGRSLSHSPNLSFVPCRCHAIERPEPAMRSSACAQVVVIHAAECLPPSIPL